jgi:hypothetical protein
MGTGANGLPLEWSNEKMDLLPSLSLAISGEWTGHLTLNRSSDKAVLL